MIIWKNEINDYVFTFGEKTVVNDSNYILSIYSKAENISKELFFPFSANTSLNVKRYDKFQIEESQIEDLSNGIINLRVGQYDYTAYSTTASTITQTSGLTIVETGRINVQDRNKIEFPVYYGGSNDQQVYVFK